MLTKRFILYRWRLKLKRYKTTYSCAEGATKAGILVSEQFGENSGIGEFEEQDCKGALYGKHAFGFETIGMVRDLRQSVLVFEDDECVQDCLRGSARFGIRSRFFIAEKLFATKWVQVMRIQVGYHPTPISSPTRIIGSTNQSSWSNFVRGLLSVPSMATFNRTSVSPDHSFIFSTYWCLVPEFGKGQGFLVFSSFSCTKCSTLLQRMKWDSTAVLFLSRYQVYSSSVL